MKQTAVEWFFYQLYTMEVEYEAIMKLYEQAKAMEKEQMRQASCPYVGGWEEGEFEDWYNETYNKDESTPNL